MYAGAPHVCSAHRGEKRALDPLELELQLVVSYHVGAGVQKEPVSSAREVNSLLYWPFSPAPFADIAWSSEELGGSRTQTTWQQLRICVHAGSWPPLSTCKLNDFWETVNQAVSCLPHPDSEWCNYLWVPWRHIRKYLQSIKSIRVVLRHVGCPSWLPWPGQTLGCRRQELKSLRNLRPPSQYCDQHGWYRGAG